MLIDGEPLQSIAATDRALHYGDGVFETIAVLAGRPRLWQAHMVRLLQGCERLAIPPPDLQRLADECSRLCVDGEEAVLKVIISRGSGGRGYRPPATPHPRRILIRYPWPAVTAWWSDGARLIYCQTPLACHPLLSGVKHLNRLEQVIARSEWQDDTIHEGLMCDSEGRVIEGTMSNLFALKDGVLYTPELAQCGIAGIMRGQVMAMAAQQGILCRTVTIRPDDLADMDELLISNSLIGMVPVRMLADRSYPISQGQRLRQALLALLEQQ